MRRRWLLLVALKEDKRAIFQAAAAHAQKAETSGPRAVRISYG
jgi:antirestriction protein ArdC